MTVSRSCEARVPEWKAMMQKPLHYVKQRSAFSTPSHRLPTAEPADWGRWLPPESPSISLSHLCSCAANQRHDGPCGEFLEPIDDPSRVVAFDHGDAGIVERGYKADGEPCPDAAHD